MKKDDFDRRVRLARFGQWLARSAFRKKKGWLDRLRVRLLARVLRPADPAKDFMRDEIVDADIGFDAEELARWQRGER